MRDVVFILVIVGFFAIAAAYVRACGWIIGPEEATRGASDELQALDVAEIETSAR